MPPDDDIHRVACAGRETAVSIHVYGTDIASRRTSIDHRLGEVPVRRGAGGAPRVSWRREWGGEAA
ncbi:MAG TPA: hypothetical protein VIA06_20545 [Candidatus Dormibacteraeota bacterium]|nr:hypothetical protein [Candidatus Dormibacteraeota bacterium]